MTYIEKNLRFYLGNRLGNSKSMFFLNRYRSFGEGKLIDQHSALCIEGFQRSGNSYLVNFFTMVNPTIEVASHCHAAMQIHQALALQIPVVLLIRNPLDAVASLRTWNSKLSIGVALQCYLNFYYSVLPVQQQCLLVHFKTLICEGVDPVILNINHRFKTNFKLTNFGEVKTRTLIKEGEIEHDDLQTSPYPNLLKAHQNKMNREKVKKHPIYRKAILLYNRFEKIGDLQTVLV